MAMKLTTESIKLRFPNLPNISTEQLYELMKAESSKRKLVLLDVREKIEFQVSRICNACHVSPSLKDMEHVMKMIMETGESGEDVVKVVCYCSVGYRSSYLAQQLLCELDKPVYQEMKSKVMVYNLEGSIFKWANEGKELEDNKGFKTVVVHPYNMIWGKLLNAELRCSEPRESSENEREKQPKLG